MPIEPTARLVAGQPPPPGAYDADIIILTLERPEASIAAIGSALTQRGLAHHVIVLDQGSSPATLATLAASFPQARNFALYSAPANLGVGGGRNLATALGHGQTIIGLDNDAVFKTPYVAARAHHRLTENPSLGALAFNILGPDGKSPDLLSWGYPAPLRAKFTSKFDTTTFVGAGHAIRRTTWNAAGPYDASLFFTWEEYDFCLRVIARNWRIQYDGSLAVIHNASPAARITWQSARLTHYIRNRLVIARKWGASWPALTPRILGYLLKAALSNQLPAALAGITQALQTHTPPPQTMPPHMRHYIKTHETRPRGTWPTRIRHELLGSRHVDPVAGE